MFKILTVLWHFEFAILDSQNHILIRNDGFETFFVEIISWIFFGDGQYKIASPSTKTFDDAVKVRKQGFFYGFHFKNVAHFGFVFF